MDVINIETFVTISPHEIGTNLKSLVLKKLEEMYIKKCIKKYGYIIEILDYFYDETLILSKVNQFMYLKCYLKLLTLTPKVNEVYYAFVKIVYPQGIFVQIMNIFDTLIPIESLKRCDYSYKNDEFVNKNGHSIKKNGFLNVRVIDINYDKKNFNCIAEIFDVDAIELKVDNEDEESIIGDDETVI